MIESRFSTIYYSVSKVPYRATQHTGGKKESGKHGPFSREKAINKDQPFNNLDVRISWQGFSRSYYNCAQYHKGKYACNKGKYRKSQQSNEKLLKIEKF